MPGHVTTREVCPDPLASVRHLCQQRHRLGVQLMRSATIASFAKVLLACVIGTLASVAAAQPVTTASLQGTVSDATGAVVQAATVRVTGRNVPAAEETTTDENGMYALRQLPPGVYDAHVTAPGFSQLTHTAINLKAGVVGSMDFVLTVGGLTETISIASDLPPVDRSNPFDRLDVSGELQRTVPITRSDDWSDVLALAPGVALQEAGTLQAYSFSFYAAPPSSNSVRIDGLPFDSAFLNGMLQLNTSVIQDTQIRSGASDAAVPLGLGAFVNIITVTGQEKLRGSAEYTFQAKGWNDVNVSGGTSSASALHRVTVSAGGPLWPQRAWFLGQYLHSSSSTGLPRTPEQLAILRSLETQWEPTSTAASANFGFAKITFNPAVGHTLNALYQRDTRTSFVASPTWIDRIESSDGGSAFGTVVNSSWSSHIASTASLAYNDKGGVAENELGSVPSTLVYRSALPSGGILTGNSLLAQLGGARSFAGETPSEELTASASLQIVLPGKSRHDIRTGIEWVADKDYLARQTYVGGVVRVEATLGPGGSMLPFSRDVYSQQSSENANIKGSQIGFHVQHNWQIRDTLALASGARFDRTQIYDRIALRDVLDTWSIGPRVGVVWSPRRDGRVTVRANVGRVHESLANSSVSAGSVTAGFERQYDLNGDGVFETTRVTPPSTIREPRDRIIDVGQLKQPSVDEASISAEWRIPKTRSSVSGSFKHRAFKDRFVYLETNRRYEGVRFVGYRNEAENDLFLTTNNRWNTPIAKVVDIVVQRDSGPLRLLASYSRQWRELDGTWEPDDIAGMLQPGAFQHTRGLGTTFGFRFDTNAFATSNGYGGTEWHDHVVKLSGSVVGPWGINGGLYYTWQSGVWSGPILRRLPAADPSVGPGSVTLSNGRVVSNPLSTVLRFAGPTRDDGQFQYPAYQTLNLHVDRDLRFAGAVITFGGEVYNLANRGENLQQFSSGSVLVESPDFGKSGRPQRPRAAVAFARVRF